MSLSLTHLRDGSVYFLQFLILEIQDSYLWLIIGEDILQWTNLLYSYKLKYREENKIHF